MGLVADAVAEHGSVGAAAAAAAEEDDDESALPSNVSLPSVIAHARRMGMPLKPLHAREMAHVAVTSGRNAIDAQIASVVAHHMEAMNESMWGDQDFGSGGPVYVASAHAILAAGKDGVLYTGNANALGNTQPADLAAGHFAAIETPAELSAVVTDFEREFNAQGIPTRRAAYQLK